VYQQANGATRCWLDAFGGRGPVGTTSSSRPVRTRASTTFHPAEKRRRSTNHWASWAWGQCDGEYEVVQVEEVLPVCTAKRETTFGDDTVSLVVIAESDNWGDPVQWAKLEATWEPDMERIAGTSYLGTRLTQMQSDRRHCTWSDTMACATEESVLYGYSDCSKIKVGPRQVLSYGWLTAGLASPQCVIENADGSWDLVNSDYDFADLRPGLWGGAIVQGPQKELTTYRGEAFGALGTMVGTRLAGYVGRLSITLDNEAVVNKFNARQPMVEEPSETGEHQLDSAPCLDDLADSDLWAAIDQERRRWGKRLRVQWNRSHPEKRKARAAWTRGGQRVVR
jgi:hypothetical protein